jgi:hypothetical protein
MAMMTLDELFNLNTGVWPPFDSDCSNFQQTFITLTKNGWDLPSRTAFMTTNDDETKKGKTDPARSLLLAVSLHVWWPFDFVARSCTRYPQMHVDVCSCCGGWFGVRLSKWSLVLAGVRLWRLPWAFWKR